MFITTTTQQPIISRMETSATVSLVNVRIAAPEDNNVFLFLVVASTILIHYLPLFVASLVQIGISHRARRSLIETSQAQ